MPTRDEINYEGYADETSDKHFLFSLPISMRNQQFAAKVLSTAYIITLDRTLQSGKEVRIILIKAKAMDLVTGALYTFSMSEDQAEMIQPGQKVVLIAQTYKGAKRSYLTLEKIANVDPDARSL